jgi:TonB family protein
MAKFARFLITTPGATTERSQAQFSYKRLCTVLLLLAVLACPAARSQQSPAIGSGSWFQPEIDRLNIRTPGSAPFHLRATVRVPLPGDSTAKGRFEEFWQDRSHWKQLLEVADYQRLRVGDEVRYWQKESTDHEPLLIYQLDSALRYLSELSDLAKATTGKPRIRNLRGARMNCARGRERNQVDREACFDAAGGTLLWIADPESPFGGAEGMTRNEYSNYLDWNGKRIPGKILVIEGGSEKIEFQVQSVEPWQAGESSAFNVPQGAEEYGNCAGMKAPEGRRTPMPHYPHGPGGEAPEGYVDLYVVVEPDGTLKRPTVVRSAGALLDAAALEGIRQWQFKPATCQDKPVRAKTVIEVGFSFRE